MRSGILVPVLLLASSPAFGQSSPSDSQTLQALLAEVRQLRHDLQTATADALRAQILLYRWQRQEAVVASASQRLGAARVKLTETQTRRARLTSDIQQNEDFLGRNEGSTADRKGAEDTLSALRAGLSQLQIEEQQGQTKVIEADEELQTERGKLAELETQLDKMERTLEKSNQQKPLNCR
jgi:chromosome segregation ATPase